MISENYANQGTIHFLVLHYFKFNSNWGYIKQRPPVVVLGQIGCIYEKEKKFLAKNPLSKITHYFHPIFFTSEVQSITANTGGKSVIFQGRDFFPKLHYIFGTTTTGGCFMIAF